MSFRGRLTLFTAAGFAAFGLYGLSGAGDVRRLPLLRTGLAAIASIFILRGTLLGGIDAVYEGNGAQIAFAATSLFVGLCYAYGAVTRRGDIIRERKKPRTHGAS